MLRQFIIFNLFFFAGLLVISWFVKLTLPIEIAYALITGAVFGWWYPLARKKNKPK
jgi:hypothetical protein